MTRKTPGPIPRLRPAHFYPLVGFLVPTLGIGYGVVIPGTCVAGMNVLNLGFAQRVLGACVTSALGLRAVLHDAANGEDDATS